MTEEIPAGPPPAGRYVEEEVVTPPPRRPLLWPWLVLLLALVLTGIAAAYFLTRDDAAKTEVPNVVGLTTALATEKLGQDGYLTVVNAKASNRPLGTVISQNPPAGTELDRGGRVTIVVAGGPLTVEVPNVVGLPVDKALIRLQAANLRGQIVKVASTKPKDQVIRQLPPGGSKAKKDSTVALTVSSGPGGATVPSVKGLTEASATATLSRLGFRLSISRIPSTQPKGIVISQQPPPGTKAPKGSIVGLNVSAGSAPAAGGVAVPQVVGLDQVAAIDKIEQAGLTVDSFPVGSSKPRNTVVSELPGAGTKVPPRSVVRINVSLGPGTAPQRPVPDVTSQPEADARRALARAGFTVRTLDQPTADSAENGIVLKQKPAGGEQATAGSQIVIYVGRLPTAEG
ncbi:MAG: PASTA domain-containing protein [Actinomycetota bacterium]